MVDKDYLVKCFLELIKIDSESGCEKEVANWLKNELANLGLEVYEDDAQIKIGKGDSGNLYSLLKAKDSNSPSLMFNAHMDTVLPGKGIEPFLNGDLITSKGQTILGGDDKSGIAIILTILKGLINDNKPHCALDILFTVQEEIGLNGARHIDTDRMKSKLGFGLDTLGVDVCVTGAPQANRFFWKIYGKEAHAGLAPTEGISAIVIAAKAIAKMKTGRIDKDTTANIGIINGGNAQNIVPGTAEVKGEVRSHNIDSLNEQTKHMLECFRSEVTDAKVVIGKEEFCAKVEENVTKEYPIMLVDDDSYTINLVKKTAEKSRRKFEFIKGGGGADANIFNSIGIETVIIGTGMAKVHSIDEQIKISDMVKTAEFLEEMILVHSNG